MHDEHSQGRVTKYSAMEWAHNRYYTTVPSLPARLGMYGDVNAEGAKFGAEVRSVGTNRRF